MYDHASFKAAARWQLVCAICEGARPWHAHHVVYEQHVAKIDARLRFHPDNALRLCVRDCHYNHHHRKLVIDISKLLDENLAFGVRLMGRDPAIAYFERYYADEHGLLTPRLHALEVERWPPLIPPQPSSSLTS